MSATKKIPFSDDIWKELRREKEPGQTWDELLQEIWIKSKKNQLSEKVKKAKEVWFFFKFPQVFFDNSLGFTVLRVQEICCIPIQSDSIIHRCSLYPDLSVT